MTNTIKNKMKKEEIINILNKKYDDMHIRNGVREIPKYKELIHSLNKRLVEKLYGKYVIHPVVDALPLDIYTHESEDNNVSHKCIARTETSRVGDYTTIDSVDVEEVIDTIESNLYENTDPKLVLDARKKYTDVIFITNFMIMHVEHEGQEHTSVLCRFGSSSINEMLSVKLFDELIEKHYDLQEK